MALSAPARLPLSVLTALLEREGLGEPHLALASAAVWGRTSGHDQVDEHLTMLGWRNRDGSLDREVASSLAVLCRPEVVYYGWFTHGGTTTAVLAGAVGREGVLAVRRDGVVRLNSVGSRRLAERLVAQLPEVRPGSGAPVVVSLDELWSTDRRGRQRARGGVVAHRARPEVRRVQELLAMPPTGAGELYGHAGPLCYVDTDSGRYAVMAVGKDAVRVGPACQPGLVAGLDGIRLGA